MMNMTFIVDMYLGIGYIWDHNARNSKRNRFCNEITIGWICNENKTHKSESSGRVDDGFEGGCPIIEALRECADDNTTYH